jgi:hypothetical protein
MAGTLCDTNLVGRDEPSARAVGLGAAAGARPGRRAVGDPRLVARGAVVGHEQQAVAEHAAGVDLHVGERAIQNAPELFAYLRTRVDAAPRRKGQWFGKSRDKSASIALSDDKGRPRIKISVDGAGVPKLEFLDDAGKVLMSLPNPGEPARR